MTLELTTITLILIKDQNTQDMNVIINLSVFKEWF